MLICTELLYFFGNPFVLNIQKTHEGYTKPENLGFCYQPKIIPSNITTQYQRRINNPDELLRRSSFPNGVNG